MNPLLILRSVTYYWRTNIAVVLGVASAVTVLSGALLVGDSVRGSLRDLVLRRLGQTDLVLTSSSFFRESLTDAVHNDERFKADFESVCPILVAKGLVVDQTSGRRTLDVQVYGVDDRFWRFHERAAAASFAQSRDVLFSPALARDLGAPTGATILLRMPRPSAIPIDSLHGQKENVGRTLRLTLRGIQPAADLGEFSLQPQQGDVRAAFVPLARLQADLELKGQVNALLVSTRNTEHNKPASKLEALVRQHIDIVDLGLRVRVLESQNVLSLEDTASLIVRPVADVATKAAVDLGMQTSPVFSYLANSIRSGDRSIPYSIIAGIGLGTILPTDRALASETPADSSNPLVLNDWAARDLGARVGAPITIDYLVWEDPGVLRTQTATFRLAAIVPLTVRAAADRDLVPVYPGITDSTSLRDWDPPFPVDLRRIRPVDEDYWRSYKTTPKAFIPFEVAQSLWQSRHGAFTSIRLTPPRGMSLDVAQHQYVAALTSHLDPFALGLSVYDARSQGLAASRGATDFGEYFTYFSFFLVVSALLLAVLFFKLGVEQRVREVGLLRAIGFTPSLVRKTFVTEGFVLSAVGSILGLVGAIGYGWLMMTALSTWWIDAVGTRALALHVSPLSLAVGGISGIAAATASIWWTLRSLARVPERRLLAGQFAEPLTRVGGSRLTIPATGLLLVGLVLMAAGAMKWIDASGAFFGAGSALLASCLCWIGVALRRQSHTPLTSHSRWALPALGVRNTTFRPGRSVLSITVIAAATFILISVDAFRRDDRYAPTDPHSGTGGYALLINSLLPIVQDPNSPQGRELFGLSGEPGVTMTPFRVLPGDDTSCLNLYEPRRPRILAASHAFVAAGRFAFQAFQLSLAHSPEDTANPWRLLETSIDDGAIPVIADANSMTYVLHKAIGDEIQIDSGAGPIRLKLVAALADSIFQGELLMSEANFIKLFPDQPGYQFLLVDAPRERVSEIERIAEDRLSDFGADAVPTGARLAEFHRVENTYLSTFQTLGGLGLLLGTIGLSAVLMRNVLERRRELALLGAVGYERKHIFTIVIAENALLLIAGLLVGTVCALVAIAPAAIERGGRLPAGASAWLLLFAVFATGLLSSFIATRLTVHTRLLNALRAE